MAILARFWVGLIAPMRCRYYRFHFICGKTKVQRSSGTWSRSCRGELLIQILPGFECTSVWPQSYTTVKPNLSPTQKVSVPSVTCPNCHLFRVNFYWYFSFVCHSVSLLLALAPGLVRVTAISQDKYSAFILSIIFPVSFWEPAFFHRLLWGVSLKENLHLALSFAKIFVGFI